MFIDFPVIPHDGVALGSLTSSLTNDMFSDEYV